MTLSIDVYDLRLGGPAEVPEWVKTWQENYDREQKRRRLESPAGSEATGSGGSWNDPGSSGKLAERGEELAPWTSEEYDSGDNIMKAMYPWPDDNDLRKKLIKMSAERADTASGELHYPRIPRTKGPKGPSEPAPMTPPYESSGGAASSGTVIPRTPEL